MGEYGVSVLIVDDERFFREAIREILEAEGLSCVDCANGEEALELAPKGDIGVVVLDIRLPGIDGIEVLRRLREQNASLQVIMLSASTDQELVLEALRLGACDYLAKPLHDEELVLAVRRAANGYSVASDWHGLQTRLARLVNRIEALSATLAVGDREKRDEQLRLAAVATAAEVLEARKTSLMLLSADGSQLRVAAVHGGAVSADDMDAVALGDGVAGVAIERLEAQRVSDVTIDPRYAGRAPEGRYESASFVVAPLAVGERRFGVLCATERLRGDFGDEDLCLLRLLAMQIAELMIRSSEEGLAFIEAEALPDGPQLASASAETPCDGDSLDAELARLVCDAVVSEVEPQRVIRAVLEPLASSLEADPVSIYLIDPESGALRLEGQSETGLRSDRPELVRGRGLCGLVAETGHLIASEEPESDARYVRDVDTPQDGVTGGLLCVPLQLRGKLVGLFRAFPRRTSGLSARTGEVLGAALSAAVRNVLLYRSLIESIDDVAAARRDAQGDR
jgi:DNA-binding response OmpR family regulator